MCVRVHEAPAEQLRGFKCYELQHDGSFHAVFLDQSGLLLSLLSNGLIWHKLSLISHLWGLRELRQREIVKGQDKPRTINVSTEETEETISKLLGMLLGTVCLLSGPRSHTWRANTTEGHGKKGAESSSLTCFYCNLLQQEKVIDHKRYHSHQPTGL